MYYILRKESPEDESDFAILEGELFGAYEPLPLEIGQFYKHSKPPKFFIIPKPRPSDISLKFKTDNDTQPGIMTDLLVIYEIPGLTISEKFFTFLKKHGVDNIQYFELVIEETQENQVYKNYKVANLLDLVDCIDEEKSELIMDEGGIDEVDKLVLDESRIPSDKKLFRVKGLPQLILVKENLKNAIEEEGITGCVFMDPEEYIL